MRATKPFPFPLSCLKPNLNKVAAEIARAEIPALELEILRNVPPDDMPLWYRAADALISAAQREFEA